MLPCGSQATSVGRPSMYFSAGGAGAGGVASAPATTSGLWPSTITTRPGGIELDDHVRSLVDDPDVVLRIDAHRVRELEAVVALADLADVVAVLIELEQARVGAARVDKDVSLGVGRHAHGFAQIQAGGKLQEIRHRLVRDFGHVLRFGLGLRERRAGNKSRNTKADARDRLIAPPKNPKRKGTFPVESIRIDALDQSATRIPFNINFCIRRGLRVDRACCGSCIHPSAGSLYWASASYAPAAIFFHLLLRRLLLRRPRDAGALGFVVVLVVVNLAALPICCRSI